jgi:hypothetical protein
MRHLLTVAGMLRWSSRLDFYLEADGGGYWLLDVPISRTEELDALLHSRVAVRGVRSGYAELYVVRVGTMQ